MRIIEPRFRSSIGINRTVLALAVARMADGIGNSVLFIIIPLYVLRIRNEIFPLSSTVLIGILISIYGFANAGMQPLVATVSDRIGRYKVFIEAGLLILAAATFSFIFADRYLDLIGLRVAQGVGLALEIPPTMSILTMVTRLENRGVAMGFYTTARMLGLASGPLLGGFIYDFWGFDATFYTGSAILLLAILVVEFGVERVGSPASGLNEKSSAGPDKSLLGAGILSAAFGSLLMASAFTLVSTLENQFRSRLNINAFSFAIAFSALMISRLLLQVPFGRISDRIGRKPLLIAGLLLLAPATALLGEVSVLWEFIGLRFMQGVGSAGVVVSALAYAGDLGEAQGAGRRGRQASIVTIGFSLGIALGPLMGGFLGTIFFQLPFWVVGALCLLGCFVVFFFMTETVGRDRAASRK